MTRFTRRRLSFQLVSLFDLLMIVLFAQYLEVQLASERVVSESQLETTKWEKSAVESTEQSRQLQTRLDLTEQSYAELLAELEAAKQQLQQTAANADQREAELSRELENARRDMQRIGELTSTLFRLPKNTIADILAARTPADADRLQKQLQQMAAARGSDVVRHLLTMSELQKRCDLWEVRIDDNNRVHIAAPGTNESFRADTTERFESELFRIYKTLPQPKALVIVLLSWGDANLSTRTAAVAGLQSVVSRMSEDADRRSRFEYAVLGYLPDSAAAISEQKAAAQRPPQDDTPNKQLPDNAVTPP